MQSAETKESIASNEANEEFFATAMRRVGNMSWESRKILQHEKILAVMNDPEAFLQNRALYFKSTRVVTVAKVPAASPGEPNLVLRRLNYGKTRHRFRDAFRASRTRRALRRGVMLEKCGIATPCAFAAADVRRFFWPRAAYLITKEVPGARTLSRFLAQNARPSRQVVWRMADLLAQLHNNNFSHRDLKPTNILLDGDSNPLLIDLDGLRRFACLSEKRAVADLARFAEGVSRHQKSLRLAQWRFLKRYCQQRQPPISPHDFSAKIEDKLRAR
jgi:tRNA A-37 threonylcarbamoyl transferase component Bud32